MAVPEGLYLTPNFITEAEEEELISYLDSKIWSTTLSRRTQHYGYEYNYSSKNVSLNPITPISGPLGQIAERISDLMVPTQCIVNEYTRNQGIAPHIDNLSFGPIVLSLSLNADTVMNFISADQMFPILLPRLSIVMLSGPARYSYKHAIDKKVSYMDPETQTKIIKPLDYRRISLTFRTLKE